MFVLSLAQKELSHLPPVGLLVVILLSKKVLIQSPIMQMSNNINKEWRHWLRNSTQSAQFLREVSLIKYNLKVTEGVMGGKGV